MFCSKCGDSVEQNEIYCNKCGNYVGNNTQNVSFNNINNSPNHYNNQENNVVMNNIQPPSQPNFNNYQNTENFNSSNNRKMIFVGAGVGVSILFVLFVCLFVIF